MKGRILYIFLIIIAFYFASHQSKQSFLFSENEDNKESNYYVTWSTSEVLIASNKAPKLPFKNNTLRQIVKVSIGSNKIRVKLSNLYGKTNLEINSVSIANSIEQGTGKIDTKTNTKLTFNKEENITILPGEEIYSDTFFYQLESLSEVAISIYFNEAPSELTGHDRSCTYSFIENGNKINEEMISSEYKINHWYFISGIEIYSEIKHKTIVCFGDSITDGHGSDEDKQSRWPDYLSYILIKNKNISNFGIDNQGISGSKIITEGIPRYSREVLNQKGVSYIIVLYGINDININDAKATEIITAYKKLIKLAHSQNILIYGATLLPYAKYTLRYTIEKDEQRHKVNKWIRETNLLEGGFDAVIDFDNIIKDKNNNSIISNEYDSGDGLHPNSYGYSKMAQSINISLFEKEFLPELSDSFLSIEDKNYVKFILETKIEQDKKITLYINGINNNNNFEGIKVFTTDELNSENSNVDREESITTGYFKLKIKLSVTSLSSFLMIKEINDNNINHIIINSIQIIIDDDNEIQINPRYDSIFDY